MSVIRNHLASRDEKTTRAAQDSSWAMQSTQGMVPASAVCMQNRAMAGLANGFRQFGSAFKVHKKCSTLKRGRKTEKTRAFDSHIYYYRQRAGSDPVRQKEVMKNMHFLKNLSRRIPPFVEAVFFKIEWLEIHSINHYIR